LSEREEFVSLCETLPLYSKKRLVSPLSHWEINLLKNKEWIERKIIISCFRNFDSTRLNNQSWQKNFLKKRKKKGKKNKKLIKSLNKNYEKQSKKAF